MHRGLVVLTAFVGLFAGGAEPAAAEEEGRAEAGESRVAPVPLIPIAEIGPEAERVAAQLRRMTEAIADTEAFDRLEADVARTSRRAAEQWDRTGHLLAGAPRRSALDSLESGWFALRIDFDRLGESLEARAQQREADLAALVALAESWTASRGLAREASAPTAVLERVDATLAAIGATRLAVERRRDRVLVLQDTVSRARQAAQDSLLRIANARRDAVQRALSSRERPVWQALREGRLSGAAGAERLAQQLDEWLGPLLAYVGAHGDSLVGTLALWPLLTWLLYAIGAPVPIASAFLFALLLTIPLRTQAPVVARQLALVAGLAATLAVLRPLARPRAFASACVLSALLLVDLLRTLFWVWPALEQVMLLAEFALGTALFLWAGPDLPSPWRMRAAARWFARVFAGASAFAAAAAAFGLLELADYVGSGVIILACVGLVVDALRGSAEQVVALAQGRMAAREMPGLERGTQRLLDVTALVVWLSVVLDRYELRKPVTDVAARLLGAQLEVGGAELSLGAVLGFVLTVLAGWLLAHVAVFVLDAVVFPRTSLPRGVPYALTSITRYGLLLAGFLLALATLGLDLGHLTLLVSALGVGLGFGLQQIVRDVVSGLILLFERPVQMGDAVQLGDLTGLVGRIGLRSSTLRTFDGAEVIVPNSQLIEQRLTNWTLSDRRRRIALAVRVEKDRDPAGALALLLEVAARDARILRGPAPEALLLRLDANDFELELRVWTVEPNWMSVKSELGVAVHAALHESGIGDR